MLQRFCRKVVVIRVRDVKRCRRRRQGRNQAHGDPNFVKMADFKVYLIRQYACNQKTNGEL